MARKKTPAGPSLDVRAFVAYVLEGCGPDAFRGAHVGLSLADAVARVGGREVSRTTEELTYGSHEPPTPIERVHLERPVEGVGVPLLERVEVTSSRRPQREFTSLTWSFVADADLGKAMGQAARALKQELGERMKRRDGAFVFTRDGRKNAAFASHGPSYLRVALSDEEF